jgi:hypothetical protein
MRQADDQVRFESTQYAPLLDGFDKL